MEYLKDFTLEQNINKIAEIVIKAMNKKISNQKYEIDKTIIRMCKKKHFNELIELLINWIDDPEVMPKNADESIQLLEMRVDWMN